MKPFLVEKVYIIHLPDKTSLIRLETRYLGAPGSLKTHLHGKLIINKNAVPPPLIEKNNLLKGKWEWGKGGQAVF